MISEQKKSSAEYAEQASSKEDSEGPFAEEESGGTITFVPRVRLAEFQVSDQEQFGVLALQVHAAHGGERLEISFPSDEEKAILKAMKHVLPSRAHLPETVCPQKAFSTALSALGTHDPSRLYHRRPALCSGLGAHRDAAKPRST